jgi:hypothetical protein
MTAQSTSRRDDASVRWRTKNGNELATVCHFQKAFESWSLDFTGRSTTTGCRAIVNA